MATAHLVEQGHRRIAFLTSVIRDSHIFPRFDGYLDGLRDAGLVLDLELVHETLRQETDVATALAGWRNLKEPPTAVLLSGFGQAQELIGCCREQGVRVPADLAIVCFDNTRESALLNPALTVVDLRKQRQGEEAVSLLLQLARGELDGPVHRRLEPTLIIRESSRRTRA